MTNRTDFERRRRDTQIAADADEVELEALRVGFAVLDHGIKDERIADTLPDEGLIIDPIESPGWMQMDQQIDSAVSDIGSEITRRAGLMKGTYPFILERNHIRYRRSRSLVYEVCLAISCAQSLSEGTFSELPRIFERMALAACRVYLSVNSVGLRTGWPYEDIGGTKPASFKEIADHLHSSTGEWIWRPVRGFPQNPNSTELKDLGIDFVVWKPMPDGREGQLFLVGQCACGQTWDHKFNDLDLKLLHRWFETATFVDFVKTFAIPRHVRNDIKFREVLSRAGLLFERARLAMLAEMTEDFEDFFEDGTRCIEVIKMVVPDFEVSDEADSQLP